MHYDLQKCLFSFSTKYYLNSTYGCIKQYCVIRFESRLFIRKNVKLNIMCEQCWCSLVAYNLENQIIIRVSAQFFVVCEARCAYSNGKQDCCGPHMSYLILTNPTALPDLAPLLTHCLSIGHRKRQLMVSQCVSTVYLILMIVLSITISLYQQLSPAMTSKNVIYKYRQEWR